MLIHFKSLMQFGEVNPLSAPNEGGPAGHIDAPSKLCHRYNCLLNVRGAKLISPDRQLIDTLTHIQVNY
jgi:hypothetical protein